MGRTWRQRLNGRQRKVAICIVAAIFLVGFCGSRGGDSTERQPAGTVDHADAGGLDPLPTPWVEESRLVTDLPEVEPSYWIEPTPEPEPVKVEAAQPAYVPPAPVQRVPAAGAEQWRDLVASIMPAETVDRWLRVIDCESGGVQYATGAAGEKGLLQVMPYYHQAKADALFGAGADLYDPVVNLSVAYVISGGGYSFGPWSCKGW